MNSETKTVQEHVDHLESLLKDNNLEEISAYLKEIPQDLLDEISSMTTSVYIWALIEELLGGEEGGCGC